MWPGILLMIKNNNKLFKKLLLTISGCISRSISAAANALYVFELIQCVCLYNDCLTGFEYDTLPLSIIVIV